MAQRRNGRLSVEEVLAVLDEFEPWPTDWPGDLHDIEVAHKRVSDARAALAATFGLSRLQLMQAERIHRP